MTNYTLNLKNLVEQIKDGRRKQGKRYQGETIIWLLLIGSLCGRKNLTEVYELFSWQVKLKKLVEKITGQKLVTIPHPTTISRALGKMNWQDWLKQINWNLNFCLDDLLVAVDGKTMRGIHDGSARHILSLINQDCLPLGQKAVETKENEITAFGQLLGQLALPQGAVITVDALLTQVEIIKLLGEKGLHYVFKVKDNQKELKSHLNYIFRQGLADHTYPLKIKEYQRQEFRHDRETSWKIVTTDDFDSTDLPGGFSSAKTIGFIYTTTKRPAYDHGTGVKTYHQAQTLVFFISSLHKSASELYPIIRGHWRIENNLHWLKDTLYQEDKQTLSHHPAHLFTFLKSLALALIKQFSSQISHTTRRIATDFSYLHYVLHRLEVI
jgi:predicted transposase YbfD/YdcC